MLVFAALYFTMVVNVYGLSFWVGEMVDQIDGIGDVAKGFVTAIPYAVAIVGMIVIPRYSDRTGERKAVVAVSLLLAAAAFVASTVVGPVAAIPALAVGLFFLLGVHGVFWTMPTAMLSGAAAAAGIALINSIGNIGGFVGPYLVGLVKDATGSTDGGLIMLAAILAIGSAIALKVAHEKELEPAPEETLARTGRFDRTSQREPAGRWPTENRPNAPYLAALMNQNGFSELNLRRFSRPGGRRHAGNGRPRAVRAGVDRRVFHALPALAARVELSSSLPHTRFDVVRNGAAVASSTSLSSSSAASSPTTSSTLYDGDGDRRRRSTTTACRRSATTPASATRASRSRSRPARDVDAGALAFDGHRDADVEVDGRTRTPSSSCRDRCGRVRSPTSRRSRHDGETTILLRARQARCAFLHKPELAPPAETPAAS